MQRSSASLRTFFAPSYGGLAGLDIVPVPIPHGTHSETISTTLFVAEVLAEPC
jgi:hypothetical protein